MINADTVRLCVEIQDGLIPGASLPPNMERKLYRGGGTSFKPMFFLLTQDNDVYIVIRGAAEMMDFAACLDFPPVPFQGGFLHHGILESARWIIEQSRSYIDNCTGRIVCTGHSYGGALTTMITTLLYLEEHKNVIGVAFAPFPCVSTSINNKIHDRIVSFVYNNDIVPRLNQSLVTTLINVFFPQGVNAIQLETFLMPILSGIIQQGAMFGFASPSISVQQFIPKIVNQILQTRNVPSEQGYYPAGSIYYITTNVEEGIPVFTKVQQVPQLSTLNLMTIMSYIMDHNAQTYFDNILFLEELD